MEVKKIVTAGIAGGVLLLILMIVSGFLVNLVLPANLSEYGGMRAMDDPVMNLFYIYPFVVASAAAIVFD